MLFGGVPQEPTPAKVAEDPRGDAIIPRATDPLLDEIMRDKVLQWRCHQFLKAGFNMAQARRAAVDRSIDLDFVRTRLVGRGCDPSTAFDIAS